MSTTGLLAMLIVVVLGAFIAATSIPSYLSSRQGDQPTATGAKLKANEASVIASLRVLYRAELTYSVGDGLGSYGTLAALGSTGAVDQHWVVASNRSGYQFELILDSPGNKGFCATAERLSDKMGDYAYAVSQQGVTYQLAGDTAPACDPNTGVISTGTVLGS